MVFFGPRRCHVTPICRQLIGNQRQSSLSLIYLRFKNKINLIFMPKSKRRLLTRKSYFFYSCIVISKSEGTGTQIFMLKQQTKNLNFRFQNFPETISTMFYLIFLLCVYLSYSINIIPILKYRFIFHQQKNTFLFVQIDRGK